MAAAGSYAINEDKVVSRAKGGRREKAAQHGNVGLHQCEFW